jgi:hypothetical protein
VMPRRNCNSAPRVRAPLAIASRVNIPASYACASNPDGS